MAQGNLIATGSQATAEPAAGAQLVTPNQYHLHGGGISVSYFPEGFGPLPVGPPQVLVYQDAQRSRRFHGDEIRIVEVPDLGTVVSVTIVQTVDVGNTTFSLLVPHVRVPAQPGASASIQTDGITTVHRAFVALIGHAQVESYTVTCLSGTASRGILPV